MVDEQCFVVKKDDDRVELLQHPHGFFSPSSYELSNVKRARAGSISQRLRSVSDLEERGVIDKSQKGVLKDLIISGDEAFQTALDMYEGGDVGPLTILMKQGALDRKDSLDLLKDLEIGLMSVGMSSTGCESEPEGFPSSPNGESDNFPSKEILKSISSLPLPVVFPKLRAEQSNSPQFKSYQTYAPNQMSLSEMSFDAAFHHDYNTQAPFVPVKSDKTVDCLNPVEVSVGPLEAARGHSDSITVVEQAAEAVKAEMVESVAVQEHHPPGYEAIEALSSELPLQFPFNDEIAEELGDGLHALVAQYEQHMGNDAANSKAKGYNGINSQAPSVNPVTNISIPKLPLRTSGDKHFVGAYSPGSRIKRVERFLNKRKHRIWTKIVKYDVRKNFADTRMRVKGRFVKKDDEALLREVMALA